MRDWEMEPFGDRAVLLRWGSSNADVKTDPAACAAVISRGQTTWIVETVLGYDTLLVHIDALRMPERTTDATAGWNVSALAAELERIICENAIDRPRNDDVVPKEGAIHPETREIVVPVLYGGEAGPDLAFAASHSGLCEAEFVRRHVDAAYRVAMIGFAPGFPYLTGLPEALALPRLSSPRRAVPAGSVGIAGGQTGVYPVESPGGWRIVGRTPLRLFRPEAPSPFPIRPGDRLRFAGITEEEFRRLSAEEEEEERAALGRLQACPLGEPALEAIDPGYYTTVQAGQRIGWRAYGVSAGGPMDGLAAREANWLVGGRGEEPLLELTLAGGRFSALRDCLVALTGADMRARVGRDPVPTGQPFLLKAGTELAFGSAAGGCRAYLAIAGGIAVPESLGSESTDTRAGIGGVEGRPLIAGDRLVGGPPGAAAAILMKAYARRAAETGGVWHAAPSRPYAASALRGGAEGVREVALRVLMPAGGSDGPEANRSRYAALLDGPFETKASSDRMGVRLGGRQLPKTPGAGTAVSHGVSPGTVQLPPGGEPIVLAANCQPTGGYPVAGHVVAADLDLLGQLRPGDRIAFRPCALPEALAAQARRVRSERLAEAGVRLAWYTGRGD